MTPPPNAMIRASLLLSFVLILLGSSHSRAEERPPDLTPRFVSRTQWQAEPPTQPMTRHTRGIRFITVHHSETRGVTPATELQRIRGIQTYHIRDAAKEGKPLFPDIAYHFLIGPSGKIYVGRDAKYQGSSFTNYDLDGHLLICLLGDFRDEKEQLQDGPETHPDEHPTDAAKDALVNLITIQLKLLDLSPEAMRTHRDLAPTTTCPGNNLNNWLRKEGRAEINLKAK